jgi:hypothetical protein
VNQVAILYPVFVQVLLVVVVGALMASARARAVKTMDRQRGNPDLAMGRVEWPDDAAKRAASYHNQSRRRCCSMRWWRSRSSPRARIP